jgi:hypothetical protein
MIREGRSDSWRPDGLVCPTVARPAYTAVSRSPSGSDSGIAAGTRDDPRPNSGPVP